MLVTCIHGSNQSQVGIFERKIVSVLNIHRRLFFLSPSPEQYRVATIYIGLILYEVL